jgi:hypothetical protein
LYSEGVSYTCSTILTTKRSVYFLQTKNDRKSIIYMNTNTNYYDEQKIYY